MKTNQPAITYYEGAIGINSAIERSLQNPNSEILAICDLKNIYEIYTSYYDEKYYIPKRIKNNIFLRMLTKPHARIEKMKDKDTEFLRELRYLPQDFKLESTIYIYNDEVLIVNSEKPYIATLIKDRSINSTMRSMFQEIWDKAKSIY